MKKALVLIFQKILGNFACINFRERPENYDFAGINFGERPKNSRNLPAKLSTYKVTFWMVCCFIQKLTDCLVMRNSEKWLQFPLFSSLLFIYPTLYPSVLLNALPGLIYCIKRIGAVFLYKLERSRVSNYAKEVSNKRKMKKLMLTWKSKYGIYKTNWTRYGKKYRI